LTHFNISYNKLGELASIFLAKDSGLFSSPDIETLMLVECNLEDDYIKKTFVKLLPKFENLRDLDLSHNFLERSYKTLMTNLYLNSSVLTRSLIMDFRHSSNPSI